MVVRPDALGAELRNQIGIGRFRYRTEPRADDHQAEGLVAARPVPPIGAGHGIYAPDAIERDPVIVEIVARDGVDRVSDQRLHRVEFVVDGLPQHHRAGEPAFTHRPHAIGNRLSKRRASGFRFRRLGRQGVLDADGQRRDSNGGGDAGKRDRATEQGPRCRPAQEGGREQRREERRENRVPMHGDASAQSVGLGDLLGNDVFGSRQFERARECIAAPHGRKRGAQRIVEGAYGRRHATPVQSSFLAMAPRGPITAQSGPNRIAGISFSV